MNADSYAADRREIAHIVTRLYASVSSPAGVEPPIDREKELLHPRARKCRTLRDEAGRAHFQIIPGESYADDVRRLVTEIGFFEVEMAHQCFVYGHVAQVVSHYEAYADEARTRRLKKGVNLIQLLKVEGEWKVFSMIWDDEENRVLSSPEAGGRSS
jgi:hypothetical protein